MKRRPLFWLLAICLLTASLQAADPRRNSESTIVAAYEAQAIAKARQRPDVIRLRCALATAKDAASKNAISAELYAILDEAARQGRLAGLAAVEAQRRADADHQRQIDEERRHQELIQALSGFRR